MPDRSGTSETRAAMAPAWVGTLFDKIYTAYNAKDADGTRDCYVPDLEVVINGEPGPRDREAFIDALREQWKGFPDVTATEIGRYIVQDRVITEMVIDGHNTEPFLDQAPTGKRWTVTLAWICELADGRVRSIRAYVDNAALQQAVSISAG